MVEVGCGTGQMSLYLARADRLVVAADLTLASLNLGADAARRFAIPLDAFGELIDGCEADVRGTTYLTFDDLLHYCRCVAGYVAGGRAALAAIAAADHDVLHALARPRKRRLAAEMLRAYATGR